MQGSTIQESSAQIAGNPLSTGEPKRRSQWNWLLLLSAAIAAAAGLGAVMLPLLESFVGPVTPWGQPHFLLPGFLSLLVVVLTVYITKQQRQATQLRQELTSKAEQHHKRLVALLTVSRIMGTETSALAVFDAITNTCLTTFECEQVSLMRLSRSAGDLVVQSVAGQTQRVLGNRQPVGQGISGWVAKHRKSVVLGESFDATQYPGFARRASAPTAAMIVPILVREDLMGVLNVASRVGGHAYGDDDVRALEIFAENAGTCIRHAEQGEWMRQLIASNAEGREQLRAPVAAPHTGVQDKT